MNVAEAIELRRSVKAYDPNHRMSDKEIEKLMSLAMLSPTAWNIQNWRFVLVSDPALRMEIRQAAWDQAQVTDASLLVVLCADLKAWENEPGRYWRNAPQPVQVLSCPPSASIMPAESGFSAMKPCARAGSRPCR